MPDIQPLIPELAQIAENELGEVAQRLESDLEYLKEWLKKQPHINARYDDQFLVAFLRGCKFSLERAKEKLDMYYTARTIVPEFFANRDPKNSDLDYVIDQGVTLPLPYTETPGASRIFLIRIGSFDPTQTNVSNIMKVCYMITDILLWDDPNTAVAGHTILVDLRGLKFAHLTQFPASLIKKMTTSIQEAYPIRQKGIHFVNPSSGFEALFKIFCGFMSEKLRERIFVHESFDALHKEVPKRLLPTEYGGEAGDISGMIQYWKGLLLKKRDWFIEEEQYKTDEKKRIGKSRINDESFGIDGSFRSLQVD